MRLHIIRHGDPDYPNDSLTVQGRREAEALRHWVARERPDRAYHSSLGRAKLTAELALAGSGLTASAEPWAAELRDAHVEKLVARGNPLTWWDLHGHLIRNPEFLKTPHWKAVPLLAATRAEAEMARIARDSDAFLARNGAVREGGIYRLGETPFRNLAVFCHGGFGLSWLAHLLAIPAPMVWSGFFMHTSSVTTLLFDEREPGIATPRVLHFGDLSHLHLAGIAPGESGIKGNYR